jgi:hypothetical protein
MREGLLIMFTWKRSIVWQRSIIVTSRNPQGSDESPDFPIEAFGDRLCRVFEGLVKGTLAVTLYGSGAVVLSGVLFYFSWKLGIAALFVLSGLLPLGASAYLLWRLMRRGRPSRPWRRGAREAAVLKLAKRLGGRLTVADVALGTGLTLHAAAATLNDLVRDGYADLQVSPSGVLVYHCFPLADAHDKSRAECV